MKTEITKLLGIEYPIIQGGMAWVAEYHLAAAVSEAGGLGLIGASLALGIRRAHPEIEILGYNRSEESRRVALERGMVDRVTDDFAAFAPLADVIILAVLSSKP